MRLETPRRFERLGAVRIHSIQEVFQLDSGPAETEPDYGGTVERVSPSALNAIERRMAVVVPCKSERLKVIEGVLAGIPHDCLVVVVSNSPRAPVDRFHMEREALSQYARLVGRPLLHVHQGDPALAQAFEAASYGAVVDQGRVRNGKAEGMIVGIVVAMLTGREHVAFVDADNYVPGAVHEYVKAFAAGLSRAASPYAMVRISWASKPKIVSGRLFFSRFGRVSEQTNRLLNEVIEHYTSFGTDVIRTGNAGEHALSLALASELEFATGYAVEPYELVNAFEKYGGIIGGGDAEIMQRGIDIHQIQSRNPHFHDDKGGEHVERMAAVAMQCIYQSPICPDSVRAAIRRKLRRRDGRMQRVRVYPALKTLDLAAFRDTLARQGWPLTELAFSGDSAPHTEAVGLPTSEALRSTPQPRVD